MRYKIYQEVIKNLIILLSVTIIMIFLYGKINFSVQPYSNWDLASYIEMASFSPNLSANIEQPFAFRLLGPYIAGLLPFSISFNFYILTIVLSICLVCLFYFFLCQMGLSSFTSLITVILFTFNKYWFGITVWDYFQLNDLISLILIVILFKAMFCYKWVTFAIILFLGTLTRETVMIMIPVLFAFLIEKKLLTSNWQKVVITIAPSIIAFSLIRIFIPIMGGNNLFESFIIESRKILLPAVLFRLLVHSFIPFSFIPIIFFQSTLRFFRNNKYALIFIILVFLSSLFGSNNERLMSPTFVISYFLLGSILQELKFQKIFILILIVCGFFSSFHPNIGRYNLPNVEMMIILGLGLLLVVTITSIIFKLIYIKQLKFKHSH